MPTDIEELDRVHRERWILSVGFAILFVANFVLASYATYRILAGLAAGENVLQEVVPVSRVGNLIITIGMPVLTFRVSRFLGHRWWLTVLYCLVAAVPPFLYWRVNLLPVFQVLIFVLLFYGLQRKKRRLLFAEIREKHGRR